MDSKNKELSKQKHAARQKRYEEARRKNDSEEELLPRKQREAQRKRKYREANDAYREHVASKKMRKYAQRKDKCTFIARQGLSVFNETSLKHHSVGCMTYNCSACAALMFKEEQKRGSLSENNYTAKFSLCCAYGDIKPLPIKEPPEKLKALLTNNTSKG